MSLDETMGCRPGWQENGGHCFLRNQTDLRTWDEARKACSAFGPEHSLAEIQSSAQQQAIAHQLADAWIGLHSTEHPSDPRQFGFVRDGSKPLYTPWSSQLPRPINNENCVAATRTHIAAYNCAEVKPFVCMTGLTALGMDPNDSVKPPQDYGCQLWGYGYKEKCYYMGVNSGSYFGTRRLVTFDAARAFCLSEYNGDLAAIRSQNIQNLLTAMLTAWQADYWIGLRERGSSSDGFEKWLDNTTVSYTNWAYTQPHISYQEGGCVAGHSTRSDTHQIGNWYATDCDQLKFAICEGLREGWTAPTDTPTVALPLTNVGNGECAAVVYQSDAVRVCSAHSHFD